MFPTSSDVSEHAVKVQRTNPFPKELSTTATSTAATTATVLSPSLERETLPEPQRLISSRTDNSLLVGTDGDMEDPVLMALQLSDLDKSFSFLTGLIQLPDIQLVAWVPVRGEQFSVVHTPEKAAHL